jgi:hypothetical protein
MNARTIVENALFTCAVASAMNLIGCTGGTSDSGGDRRGAAGEMMAQRFDGGKMSADDTATTAFVQTKIDQHWAKNADGWVTQLHKRNAFGEEMEGVPEVLYLQYRDMKFSVNPVTLTESQRLNGTTYRAEITSEYVPARRFHTEKSMSAPPGWSRWDQEQPAEAIVVELRNGKWLMSDAELFAGAKPDVSKVPGGT